MIIEAENSILDQLKTENEFLRKQIARKDASIADLKFQLEQLQRVIFGAKSERHTCVSPQQLSLGFEVQPTTQAKEDPKISISYERSKSKPKAKPVRAEIAAHLPRIVQVIEPEEIVEGSQKIGEEITEVIEYTPGHASVTCYVRPKYALPQKQGVVIADLPSLPLPKSNAGASLLAWILVSKYMDHLPYHRQGEILKRSGLTVPQSTFVNWFNNAANLLTPLYDVAVKKVLSSNYIAADETPIKVMDSHKEGGTHTGYHWAYYSVNEKVFCFKYEPSRAARGPDEFLKNYQGYLQTDGYAAYDRFENRPGVTLLACMAHIRRKFEHAKDSDPARSVHVLDLIAKLYATERQAREEGLDWEQRKLLRQEKSLPVMNELEEWMQTTLQEVLPKSAIGRAIGYGLSMWKRMKRYLEDGRLEIDNNLIENSIRPIALGRKNYLFCGSHDAAQRAAVMYTLLGCCKINNVEPLQWLTETLNKIQDYKVNRLEELLPGFKPVC